MRATRPARHSTTPNSASASRAARRGLAAVLLLIVLAGPPAVLSWLVGSPLTIPPVLRSGAALTRPLDDATVLWLLATAAWLVWLHLLCCLIVEALRQTRGSNLRIPLPGLVFGANTLLASQLVATLLLPAQPSHGPGLTPFTGTPLPVAAVLTAPPQVGSPGPLPVPVPAAALEPMSNSSDGGPRHEAAIEVRVLPPHGRHHDTLWDVAERHLGDGVRWHEVFALNAGRVMPDGQRLTDASRIRPGWTLLLPHDARVLDIDRVTTSASHNPAGSAAAPPSAPDAVQSASPTPRTISEAIPPGRMHDSMDRDTASRPSEPAPAGPDATDSSQPASSLTAPATSGPPEDTRAAQPAANQHPQSLQAELAIELGTLSVAALALLAALTRRRKVAARRRPLGVRAARPAPDLLATETRLRQQARAADIAATVRLALLVAAPQLPTARVKAVWEQADGGIELVLTEHPTGVVPAPFTATARGWLLPRDGRRYLFACHTDGRRRQDRDARLDQELQARPDPFPLLLPVGEHEGSACLVNLELFGLISLTLAAGPASDAPAPSVPCAADVTQLLAAWVPTLAGAPWAELVHLFLPPAWAELAVGLDHVHLADPSHPLAMAQPLAPHDRAGLAEHDSLEAARRAGAGMADVIGAQVVLGYRLDDLPSQLLAAALDPLDGNIVVLHEPHPDAHPWTLSSDGLLTIPGVCDALRPLTLDPAQHHRLLRLLEHAQDPPHAAPDDPQRTALDADSPALTTAQLALAASPPQVIDLTAADTSAGAPPRAAGETIHDAGGDFGAGGADGSWAPSSEDVPAPGETDSRPSPRTLPARPNPGPAAERGAQQQRSGPRLQPVEVGVLGPIEVHSDHPDQPRLQALEMLVYLSLHRQPVTLEAMSEAIWPDRGYQERTVQNRIGDLRRYLGDNHLLKVSGNRWRLTDLVTSDWQRFKTLAGGNPEQQTRALALVRGIPFTHTKRDWMYLDGTFAETEASIVDLALLVGQRALKTGHYDTARDAAHAGLRACPFDERLYRLGIESAAARDATAEIRQLTNQLNWVMDTEIEPDDTIQSATNELLQRLRTEQDRVRHQQQRRG
jgi:DNA-binding SARP family transcriptional activator